MFEDRQIHDVHVLETVPLITPQELKTTLPMTDAARATVIQGRAAVRAILAQEDPRLMVVAGPCSIHDEEAAYEYAERLARLHAALGDRMLIVMRVYFEKPRTIIGWKGLISDPDMDGSSDITKGLCKGRRILLKINEMGLPAATELLDPIVPQYIADLVSWSAVGARTTESQTHREMASGLSMPVGFKNSTDGNLQIAIDAMQSARYPHSFLGIDQEGRTCIIRTRGNPWGHIILRGGRGKPNYEASHVAAAAEQLRKAGLPALVMVDCSHANSEKRFERQIVVWRECIEQRRSWNKAIVGLMLESNLEEGVQPLPPKGKVLRRGVSITDPCLGWDATEELLREGYALLEGRL